MADTPTPTKRPRFPNNTLDALCTWLRDGQPCPPPRFTLVAINAGVYAESDGIPIHPPVYLWPGDSVELWFVIEGGVIEYQHAGTRRELDAVPRRQLLTLLAARRLLLERFGQPPPPLKAPRRPA